MEVQITCPKCESSIDVYPSQDATGAKCDVCKEVVPVKFNSDHEAGILKDCPVCERKDFYIQKDFNRKIGVTLFVIAAIASIWTYGISFIVLYLFDLILFKKLNQVAICYKCQTNFRKLSNIKDLHPFDHEMNDRIVYADHDFGGEQLDHH